MEEQFVQMKNIHQDKLDISKKSKMGLEGPGNWEPRGSGGIKNNDLIPCWWEHYYRLQNIKISLKKGFMRCLKLC